MCSRSTVQSVDCFFGKLLDSVKRSFQKHSWKISAEIENVSCFYIYIKNFQQKGIVYCVYFSKTAAIASWNQNPFDMNAHLHFHETSDAKITQKLWKIDRLNNFQSKIVSALLKSPITSSVSAQRYPKTAQPLIMVNIRTEFCVSCTQFLLCTVHLLHFAQHEFISSDECN